jgi:succinoglycan biosynthesis protein ExoA
MTEACMERRAPASPVVEEQPLISVIVPVRNEERYIENTLNQLLRQEYPRFEVLVADGESTDATPARVRRMAQDHANLRLLPNPGRWSSAGRNAALAEARGNIVLIVDGHCDVADRQCLKHLAEAFARSGADCVGRPQPLDVSRATSLQRAIAAARASRLGHNPSSFIYSSREGFVSPLSVAVAYRRSVFDAVGEFDDRFDACEDVEFNHRVERAGLRCFFTPRVAVRYHPRASLGGLFRQMARYGRGRVRLLRKHPETFSTPCFVPAAFLLGAVAGPLVAWHSAVAGILYALALGLYALMLLATSAVLSVRAGDLRLLPWLPLVFAAIHVGAGYGAWRELLAPGERPALRAGWRVQERLP